MAYLERVRPIDLMVTDQEVPSSIPGYAMEQTRCFCVLVSFFPLFYLQLSSVEVPAFS